MKTLGNVLWMAAILTGMSSCFMYSYPVATQKPDNNKTYKIDYLFEYDGCKVYRFYDMGNYVYFTNCRGDVTSVKNDSTAERVTNSVRITYDDYEKIIKDN